MRVFVDNSGTESLTISDPIDIRHIVQARRIKPGDTLLYSDNVRHGSAEVTSISKKSIELLILHEETIIEPVFSISLIIGVPRPQALEDAVRHATEAGADNFFIFPSERSGPWKPSEKRMDRLKRILKEASMQCERNKIPAIQFLPDLNGIMVGNNSENEDRYLLHTVEESGNSFLKNLTADGKKDVLLAVGPEGGWSDGEVLQFKNYSFQKLKLVENILRVETACITGTAFFAALRSGCLKCECRSI